MGNRSRFVVVAAAAAGAFGVRALARARRRARLGSAVEGIVDVIMPSVADDAPSRAPDVGVDEIHAPGHEHVVWTAATADEQSPAPLRGRPWTKNLHGLRHPVRG